MSLCDDPKNQFGAAVMSMRRHCAALNAQLCEAYETNKSINCWVLALEHLPVYDEKKPEIELINDEMFDLLDRAERMSMKMLYIMGQYGPIQGDVFHVSIPSKADGEKLDAQRSDDKS